MSIIIALIFIVLFFLINKSSLDTISKAAILLYLCVWSLSLILSSFGFYDFIVPSVKTYFFLIVHIVTFIWGFMVYKIPQNSTLDISLIKIQTSRILKNPLFIGLVIVSCVVIIGYIAVFYKQVIIMQSLADMRDEYYEGDIYGDNFVLINNFLLSPLFLIFPTLLSLALFFKEKKPLMIIMLSTFLIGYVLLGGGRIGYIRIATFFVFMIFCLKIKKVNIIKCSFVVLLVYFVLILVSAGRYGQIGVNKSALEVGFEKGNEQIVEYTFGPVCAFDYALNHDYMRKSGGPYCGRMTLSSVEATVRLLLTRIGIDYETPVQRAGKIKGETIPVSPEFTQWNALFTSALIYYLDFGLIGIVFVPFFIGLLYRKLISMWYKKPTIYILGVICIAFCRIMLSNLDYGFVSDYEFITCLILLFLHSNSKVIRKRTILRIN